MIKIGILGVGRIGTRHMEALMQVPNAHIAAISDSNLELAGKRAATCGAPFVTDTYTDMLDKVDAVYICTPPSMHKEQVLTVASAGKAIFCEKPLASTIEDGEHILRTVENKNVRLMTAFNMRFREPYRKVMEIYQSGILGDVNTYWTLRMGPTTATGTWRETPGLLCGVTIESVSHDIDVMRMVTGRDVESVSCQINSNQPHLAGYDDNTCSTMRLKGGGNANFYISWSSPIGFNTRGLVGTKGTVLVEGPDWWTLSRVRWQVQGLGEQVWSVPGQQSLDMGYVAEAKHFVDCIEQDKPFLVDARDGLTVLKTSMAMLESAHSNKVATLNP